jgi:hypothetical protein
LGSAIENCYQPFADCILVVSIKKEKKELLINDLLKGNKPDNERAIIEGKDYPFDKSGTNVLTPIFEEH